MLTVQIQNGTNVNTKRFIVVDAHSHLGKDEDGTQMLNPMATSTGTFDFWGRIEQLIQEEWEKNTLPREFEVDLNQKRLKLRFDFKSLPNMRNIFQILEEQKQNAKYVNLWERIKYQRLIDYGIVFPFHDIYREKRTEAIYRASNMNVSRITSKFPVSIRLGGYMRCVPWEGQKAVDEVKYWAEKPDSNIRGLKLHPRSDGWLEAVTSRDVINVIVTAVNYGFPVIFDTRGRQTILDLGKLIKAVRQYLKSNRPDLISQFKAIIAHAASGNVNDEDVYDTIAQPNTYMDLSLCQEQTVKRFLATFKDYCHTHHIEEKYGRKWSEFCLYASDYPYFQELHAKAIIKTLISPFFFEMGGDFTDIQNIIGLNQIRLFPEYNHNHPLIETSPKKGYVFQPLNPQELKARHLANNFIASGLDQNLLEINKHIFTFQNDWYNYNDDAAYLIKFNKNTSQNHLLLFNNLQKPDLSLVTVMNSDFKLNPLGYRYFDANIHKKFREIFQSATLIPNPTAIGNEMSKLNNHFP